jgi:hypothetical protein
VVLEQVTSAEPDDVSGDADGITPNAIVMAAEHFQGDGADHPERRCGGAGRASADEDEQWSVRRAAMRCRTGNGAGGRDARSPGPGKGQAPTPMRQGLVGSSLRDTVCQRVQVATSCYKPVHRRGRGCRGGV